MNQEPVKLLGYSEMSDLPPQVWLVEGLLSCGTSALMFGGSNAFKSFIAIDIACSVATGLKWHEARVEQGLVVYVATEGANGVGRVRIPAWMDLHGVPEFDRTNIFLSRSELALDRSRSVDSFLSELDARRGEQRCALVVLDIFASTMEGTEVSDDTARRWISGVQRIILSTGATVLAVAHSGWQDQTRARMHSHFWGSFDTRLKVRGDKKNRRAVLAIDRHKDAESDGTWGFELEHFRTATGEDSLVPVLSEDAASRLAGARSTGQHDKALKVLLAEIEIRGEDRPDLPAERVESSSRPRVE